MPNVLQFNYLNLAKAVLEIYHHPITTQPGTAESVGFYRCKE